MGLLISMGKVAGACVILGAVLLSQMRYFHRSRYYMESLFIGNRCDK